MFCNDLCDKYVISKRGRTLICVALECLIHHSSLITHHSSLVTHHTKGHKTAPANHQWWHLWILASRYIKQNTCEWVNEWVSNGNWPDVRNWSRPESPLRNPPCLAPHPQLQLQLRRGCNRHPIFAYYLHLHVRRQLCAQHTRVQRPRGVWGHSFLSSYCCCMGVRWVVEWWSGGVEWWSEWVSEWVSEWGLVGCENKTKKNRKKWMTHLLNILVYKYK
jgi:hypothetical protein